MYTLSVPVPDSPARSSLLELVDDKCRAHYHQKWMISYIELLFIGEQQPGVADEVKVVQLTYKWAKVVVKQLDPAVRATLNQINQQYGAGTITELTALRTHSGEVRIKAASGVPRKRFTLWWTDAGTRTVSFLRQTRTVGYKPKKGKEA